MNTQDAYSTNAGAELAEVLARIVRAGWHVSLTPAPNLYGGLVEAHLTFWREDVEPRTMAGELEAFKTGAPSAVPYHYKVDLLNAPSSMLKAARKHYHYFVRRPARPAAAGAAVPAD